MKNLFEYGYKRWKMLEYSQYHFHKLNSQAQDIITWSLSEMKNSIKKNRGIIHKFRRISEISRLPLHEQVTFYLYRLRNAVRWWAMYLREEVIFYLYRLRLLRRKKSYHFESVRTVVLTIGFARSGSSLIGYLLTAHPNIIMPDEPHVSVPHKRPAPKRPAYERPDVRCLYEADLNKMFNYLVHLDWQRYIFRASSMRLSKRNYLFRSSPRTNRYIIVPNQPQGRFESLKVIGVKESRENTEVLVRGDILKNLKIKLKERKISLKFIFTIRNPKDMIATDLREDISRYRKMNSKDITKFIEKMTIFCKQTKKILQQVDPDDVFISRNEDIISHPREHLSKLCDFLQVDAPTDYLDACASRIIAKPTRSRLEIDWSQEHKRKIASLIEDYDFFRGYD